VSLTSGSLDIRSQVSLASGTRDTSTLTRLSLPEISLSRHRIQDTGSKTEKTGQQCPFSFCHSILCFSSFLSVLDHLIKLVFERCHHLLELRVLLLEIVHLALEREVLLLQVAGAHRNLVLLEAPRFPRALSGLVVLAALGPVLVVLQLVRNKLCRKYKNESPRDID